MRNFKYDVNFIAEKKIIQVTLQVDLKLPRKLIQKNLEFILKFQKDAGSSEGTITLKNLNFRRMLKNLIYGELFLTFDNFLGDFDSLLEKITVPSGFIFLSSLAFSLEKFSKTPQAFQVYLVCVFYYKKKAHAFLGLE